MIFWCCCTENKCCEARSSHSPGQQLFDDGFSAGLNPPQASQQRPAPAKANGRALGKDRLDSATGDDDLVVERAHSTAAHPPPPSHIRSNGLPYRKPRHGYRSPQMLTTRAQLPVLTPSQAPSGPALPSPSAPPRPPSPSLPPPRASRTPRSLRRSPRRPQSPSWTPSPVTASPPRSAFSPPVLVFPSPPSATSSTSSTRSPLSSSLS